MDTFRSWWQTGGEIVERDSRVRELLLLLPVEPGCERLGAALTVSVYLVVAVRFRAQLQSWRKTTGGPRAGYGIDHINP